MDEIIPACRGKRSIDQVLEDQLPLGYFHWRLLVICGLSFIADGMEISLMVFISSCVGKYWDLSNGQIALLSSVVFGGQLIGTYFWGPIADIYGRRKAFIYSAFLISFAGLASGASPNYLTLLTLRGIVGFGLGGSSVPFDLLAEYCPPKDRGSFLLYIEYFWSIGSICVTGTAWLVLPHYSWRFLTIVTAFPVVITCFISMYFLPESPRWLIVQGKLKEAEKELAAAMTVNNRLCGVCLLDVHQVLVAEIDDDHHQSMVVMLVELLSSQNVGITIKMWIIWACFGAAYYGVLLYTGELFSSDSGDDDGVGSCSFDYGPIFITALAEFVGCVAIVRFVDAQGRVRTQSVAYGLGSVGALLMGILQEKHRQRLLWSMLARMGVFAASAVTWIHTPELLATNIRATGHAISNSCAQIGSFFVPFLIYSGAGDNFIGGILAALAGVAMVCVIFLPETSGSRLHDRNTSTWVNSAVGSHKDSEKSQTQPLLTATVPD